MAFTAAVISTELAISGHTASKWSDDRGFLHLQAVPHSHKRIAYCANDMSGKPVKLLVSGPIRENIDPLLARLEKLNSSPHGPFAACLVVGDVLEGGHAANPELLGACGF